MRGKREIQVQGITGSMVFDVIYTWTLTKGHS